MQSTGVSRSRIAPRVVKQLLRAREAGEPRAVSYGYPLYYDECALRLFDLFCVLDPTSVGSSAAQTSFNEDI